MRRPAILLVALLLIAGCMGEAPPPETFETGDDEEGRQSVPGSGSQRQDNTTRVWQHQVTYTLDASPPPTTMDVPSNVTDLTARAINTGTPCGTNVGEGTDALRPYGEFVSPSGNVTRLDLFANECTAGGLAVYSESSPVSLETEVGTWTVTFSGRGTGLQQTIVVEGDKVP